MKTDEIAKLLNETPPAEDKKMPLSTEEMNKFAVITKSRRDANHSAIVLKRFFKVAIDDGTFEYQPGMYDVMVSNICVCFSTTIFSICTHTLYS